MRLLLTGASGFIGNSLLEKLPNKEKIIVISRKNKPHKLKIKWIKTDIVNIDDKIKVIKNFNPNILVHLAWEGIPLLNKKNSLLNLKKNKIFFSNLLKFIKFDKIIVSGSCFEYNLKETKIFENSKLSYTPFSKAKILLYKYLVNLQKIYKYKLIWFRIFYVYGPKQRKESLIPSLVIKLKENKPVFLNFPYEKKDFIYINDIIEAIKKTFYTDLNGIFNLGSGKAYSPLYIAKFLKKKLRSQSVINFKKNDNQNNKKKEFCASITKIKSSKLNWKNRFGIKKGLINYIKNIN